jgi:hypothetical protein
LTRFGKLSYRYEKTARIGSQEKKQEKECSLERSGDEIPAGTNDKNESAGYFYERREVKERSIAIAGPAERVYRKPRVAMLL